MTTTQARFQHRQKWLLLMAVTCVLCTCAGVVWNPVGGIRLNRIKGRLAQALSSLPKGSDYESVRRFAVSQCLNPYDLTNQFGSYPPPPPAAAYELIADDPYQGQFFGMTAGVRVDFWFDKRKRYIKATFDSYGGAL